MSEIIKYRELLYFLTWRDFKVRYKQTLIGAGWAIFKPLILMVVFTFAFSRTGSVDSGSVPYPIFSYTGLIFWTYFSQSTTLVGNSMVAAQGIIKKIYFPRILIPIASALTGIVDLLLATLIYAGLIIYYSQQIHLLGVLLFLPFVLLAFLGALGVGLFMAALNVKYRDVSQALPFLIQALLFMTPVIYPISIVPDSLRWIIFLNPIAGPIEAFRATLLGVQDFNFNHLLLSSVSTVVILTISLIYFKNKEREFADLI